MSLVAGRGPLSKDPAGWFSSRLPNDLVFIEPEPDAPGFVHVPWGAVDAWLEEGRLRVDVAGTNLVDTVDTVVVFETALEPRLYVDPSLVRTDLLRRSDTASYCNYKRDATYWSAVIGDTVVEDVT